MSTPPRAFANNAPIASKDSSFAVTSAIKSHLTIAFTEWDRLSAIPLVSLLNGLWTLVPEITDVMPKHVANDLEFPLSP